MLYFILLLLWSIAECKPTNKQPESTSFVKDKNDSQLERIVQDLMQKHDNNNPTLSWEEVNAANSRPCSNEEIINGINYDYYIQYIDMNENYASSQLEDIDHVDISEPALFGCRPVMYCAGVKHHPYVSAPRNQQNNVNRKDDCFVLSQNGKTPYPHNKQRKINITENANKLLNKTTTEPTLSIPQTSSNRAVSEQLHYDPRHMYISVHNNINMGRNEQIYSQTYKENSKQQSNTTVHTTPLHMNTTKQTPMYNTTTAIPAKANAIVGMPKSKDSSPEKKHSLEYEEQQKSNMKMLLDFLASFKKKLCNDSVPNIVGANLSKTTGLIKMTTETPVTVNVANAITPLSTANKTLSDDAVIFVIHNNKSIANDTTSINAVQGLVKMDIKQSNKPLAESVQMALKADNTDADSKNNTKSLKTKSVAKTVEIDRLNTNGNSGLKSAEENIGSINVKTIPIARRRHNYGNAKNGYILATEWNNGRPYNRKERIQPHYNYNTNYNRAGHKAQPQRWSTTPRTFYWNNVVRRRYGKANDNFQPIHRFKGLPLENCNFESMNQSKLDSIDCDQQSAEKSTESKEYREYMRPNFRRQYINYMKRYT